MTQNEPGGIVALIAKTQQILVQALRQVEFAANRMIEGLPIGNAKELRGRTLLLPQRSCAGVSLTRFRRRVAFDSHQGRAAPFTTGGESLDDAEQDQQHGGPEANLGVGGQHADQRRGGTHHDQGEDQHGFAAETVTEVAGDDVPPMSHALPLTNVFRADEVRPSLPVQDVLAGAPSVEDDRFRVPRILGEEQ